MVVGVLEEILVDDNFSDIRENFMRKNCSHFENSEENKLIYTQVTKKSSIDRCDFQRIFQYLLTHPFSFI